MFDKLVYRKFLTIHIQKGHVSFKHVRSTCFFINAIKKAHKKYMLFK
jgi:hypothetical protein